MAAVHGKWGYLQKKTTKKKKEREEEEEEDGKKKKKKKTLKCGRTIQSAVFLTA